MCPGYHTVQDWEFKWRRSPSPDLVHMGTCRSEGAQYEILAAGRKLKRWKEEDLRGRSAISRWSQQFNSAHAKLGKLGMDAIKLLWSHANHRSASKILLISSFQFSCKESQESWISRTDLQWFRKCLRQNKNRSYILWRYLNRFVYWCIAWKQWRKIFNSKANIRIVRNTVLYCHVALFPYYLDTARDTHFRPLQLMSKVSKLLCDKQLLT